MQLKIEAGVFGKCVNDKNKCFTVYAYKKLDGKRKLEVFDIFPEDEPLINVIKELEERLERGCDE
jgi:hypothetical protein